MPRTNERFERVAKLVSGFESPFGLELLSTVHWVVTHEHARDAEGAVAKTYAWGERKRQFTREQVQLALRVLADRGWVEVEP